MELCKLSLLGTYARYALQRSQQGINREIWGRLELGESGLAFNL